MYLCEPGLSVSVTAANKMQRRDRRATSVQEVHSAKAYYDASLAVAPVGSAVAASANIQNIVGLS